MNQETARITEIVKEVRKGDQSNCKELVDLLRKRVIVKVRHVNLYADLQDEIIDDCISTTLWYAIKTWNSRRAKSFLTYFYLRVRGDIWNKCVVLHNVCQCVKLNSVSMEEIEFNEPYTEDKEVEYNDIVEEISNSLSPLAQQVFKGLTRGDTLTRAGASIEIKKELKTNPVVQEVANHYTRARRGRVERIWI